MTPMFATTLANSEARTESLQQRILTEDLNLGFDETQRGIPAATFLPADQVSAFDWSMIAGLFTRRQVRHA
ncbi:hypothetical protein ACSDQ9_09330 [Aestuariimicrobium soli]|uniref:hypothetical protein n=1 Tax=Aestuariimicrobium soli TaxID=2035834 RepID=UPI003EC0A6B9